MSFNEKYAKEASAAEALGLLTPAAIVAQPFIMDKINKHNDKKRKQEDQDALDQEPLEESPFGTLVPLKQKKNLLLMNVMLFKRLQTSTSKSREINGSSSKKVQVRYSVTMPQKKKQKNLSLL